MAIRTPVLPSGDGPRPLGVDAVRLRPGFWGRRQAASRARSAEAEIWEQVRSGTAAPLRRADDEAEDSVQLIRAGVARLRSHRADALTEAAARAADRLSEEGAPGIESALVELYRATGEDRHLARAKALVEWRTPPTSPDPLFACGQVDVAVETGDEELLNSVISRWEHVLATRTSLTGGSATKREDATRTAVASVMLNWRLLLATGEARFADLAERTLFNAVAVGVDTADHGAADTGLSALLACLGAYQATQTPAGVQLHQLTAADIRVEGLRLRVETDYPRSGSVVIRVLDDGGVPTERRIAVRIPAWADGATSAVHAAGRPAERRPVRPGYADETRVWRTGEEIRLQIPLAPRWTWPDPRLDAVRGCVAVERGPLVYCVRSPDRASLDALALDPSRALRPVAARGLAEEDVALLAAGLLRAPAARGWPYYAAAPHPPGFSRAEAVLVPYHARPPRGGPGATRVFLPVAFEMPDRVPHAVSDCRPSG
jgi:hypothetical protein